MEQGRYSVRETKAPDGYLLSGKENIITVNEKYVNPEKPTKAFVNVPQELPLQKTDTSGKPMEGIEFVLMNASTAEIVETLKTDKDGRLTFTKFGYGDWIIRESNVPEGYCKDVLDITIHVDEKWTAPELIKCVNIPDHYEFLKTDSSGNPMGRTWANMFPTKTASSALLAWTAACTTSGKLKRWKASVFPVKSSSLFWMRTM